MEIYYIEESNFESHEHLLITFIFIFYFILFF